MYTHTNLYTDCVVITGSSLVISQSATDTVPHIPMTSIRAGQIIVTTSELQAEPERGRETEKHFQIV
jgi:hypothetical protein